MYIFSYRTLIFKVLYEKIYMYLNALHLPRPSAFWQSKPCIYEILHSLEAKPRNFITKTLPNDKIRCDRPEQKHGYVVGISLYL